MKLKKTSLYSWVETLEFGLSNRNASGKITFLWETDDNLLQKKLDSIICLEFRWNLKEKVSMICIVKKLEKWMNQCFRKRRMNRGKGKERSGCWMDEGCPPNYPSLPSQLVFRMDEAQISDWIMNIYYEQTIAVVSSISIGFGWTLLSPLGRNRSIIIHTFEPVVPSASHIL